MLQSRTAVVPPPRRGKVFRQLSPQRLWVTFPVSVTRNKKLSHYRSQN